MRGGGCAPEKPEPPVREWSGGAAHGGGSPAAAVRVGRRAELVLDMPVWDAVWRRVGCDLRGMVGGAASHLRGTVGGAAPQLRTVAGAR